MPDLYTGNTIQSCTYTIQRCTLYTGRDNQLPSKTMHDIKTPQGYKRPKAKVKPKTHYQLSNGKVIPTFEFMAAVLRYEIAHTK